MYRRGRPVGRRNAPQEFKTQQKTYMFFEQDIKKMEQHGWKPKEVLRLGIYSKENNPQMINRIREIEKQNDLIVEKLDKYVRLSLKQRELLKKHKIKPIEED
jgi:hypothetical protein